MRHGMARAVAALLVAGGAWFALAGPVWAAPGQIGYDGCLAGMPGQGCGDLPGGLIAGANTVAVSPDGSSVYVASSPPDVVAHFVAGGPDGRIAYDDCLASGPFQTCLDLPFAPLDGAYGVAVSPDGRSVYVASNSGSVAHFFVTGPDGKLAYDGCHANSAAQGCSDLLGAPLGGASDVAVSPDGSSVYVAASAGNRIEHFLRSSPQGGLAYDGCLEGQPFCIPSPATPLNRPHGVAVSPDGRSVYVAVTDGDSIAHFVAGSPHGKLVYDGCLANDATQGCVDLPGAPLDGAWGVAVSPDGRSVYVASADSASLAHFVANGPDGRLTFDACLADTAAPNCADLPGRPLDEARSVAVSPDGRSVYVASSASGSIAHFFRDPDGQIAYDGCLANDDVDGCADLPGAPIDGAYGVAVSPNGRSVYVVSDGSGSVAHFFRSLGDGPPPGAVTTPGTRSPRGADRLRRPDAGNAQARRQTDSRPRSTPDRGQQRKRLHDQRPALRQDRKAHRHQAHAAPDHAQDQDLPRRRHAQDHRQAETAQGARPAAQTRRQAHAAPGRQAARPRRQRPDRHQDPLAAAQAQAGAASRVGARAALAYARRRRDGECARPWRVRTGIGSAASGFSALPARPRERWPSALAARSRRRDGRASPTATVSCGRSISDAFSTCRRSRRRAPKWRRRCASWASQADCWTPPIGCRRARRR